MKFKRFLALLLSAAMLLALLAGVSSCGVPKVMANELTAGLGSQYVNGKEPDEAFGKAALDFSLSLFKKNAEKSGENMLISPLSVMIALSLAANGAAGETLAEIESVLGLTKEELNAYLYTYASSFPNKEECKLQTANSVWLRKDAIEVNKPFLQNAADYYSAEVYSVAFDSATLDDINAWINLKTEGLIKKALDKIEPGTLFYLINTVLFDAEWASAYTKNSVRSGSFVNIHGEEKNVKFMKDYDKCFFGEEEKTLVKFYSGGDYAFIGVLPESGDVYGYIETLTAEKFESFFDFGEVSYAEVYLPKFEYEYSTEMKDILASMGIEKAFEANADFSAMSGDYPGELFIQGVKHNTFISVDELGTKAGAVTVISGGCGGMPPTEEIYFDRPFVYFIVDTETKMPVFAGVAADIGK